MLGSIIPDPLAIPTNVASPVLHILNFGYVSVDMILRHPEKHGNGRLVRNLLEELIFAKATHAVQKRDETPLDLLTIDVVQQINI